MAQKYNNDKLKGSHHGQTIQGGGLTSNGSTTHAPIALFVFNRPWHTQQTIKALQENELAELSDLIIFADGPKSESDKDYVYFRRNVQLTPAHDRQPIHGIGSLKHSEA